MKIIENKNLREFVEKKLLEMQPPKAISGRLKKREKDLNYVSKDSIYRYIKSVYGRRIEAHRKKQKTRHWKHRAKSKKLANRTFIDKRPLVINQRKRIG